MSSEKITLVEGTRIFKNDKETAKVLNDFFSTIIQNLKVLQYKEQYPVSDSISDPVMRVIVKYSGHPSIIAIKENCISSTPFNCLYVGQKDILKRTKRVEENEVTQNTDIPTKLIKENSDIFADFILENLNDSIYQSVLTSVLKLANITPVHKKDFKSKKDHYRPISILSKFL